MAVSFGASNLGPVGASGTTHSWAFNPGASATVMFVGNKAAGNAIPTGITHNSLALTNQGTPQDGLNAWMRNAPTQSNQTITVTYSGYTNDVFAVAGSFVGSDPTTPVGTLQGTTGTSAAPATPSITCPTDGMIWGSTFSNYSSAAPTAGSGTTLASSGRHSGSGSSIAGGYRSTTGGVTWAVGGSTYWRAWGIPINPVAAGGIVGRQCFPDGWAWI